MYVIDASMPGKSLLLLCVFEDIGLQDRHIDAAEMFQVGEVGERSLADDRNDTPRCAVIDDTREVLGHPHRDTGRAGRLELDNSPVDIVGSAAGIAERAMTAAGAAKIAKSRGTTTVPTAVIDRIIGAYYPYLASRLLSRISASAAPISRARRYQDKAAAKSPRALRKWACSRNTGSNVSPNLSAACPSPALAARP